jgi:hypothetical protein
MMPSTAPALANLQSTLRELRSLPRGVVEHVFMRLDPDNCHEDIAALRDPYNVLASSTGYVTCSFPRFAQAGQKLSIPLSLSQDYPSTAVAELEVATATLISHASVDIAVVCDDHSQQLTVSLAPAANSRSIIVTARVPVDATRDAVVVISSVNVAGQLVHSSRQMPVHLPVLCGMLAPLVLHDATTRFSCTPAIAPDGTLFVPMRGSESVLVFAADGAPCSPLNPIHFGLSRQVGTSAVDPESGTLLLADDNGGETVVLAIDTPSRSTKWKYNKLRTDCNGVAVLSLHGLVLISEQDANRITVLRLATGTKVHSTRAYQASFLSADSASATVYASSHKDVVSFLWNGDALVPNGVVPNTFKPLAARHVRPLAVVPPVPGGTVSFLIAGTFGSPTLLILSLPDHCLVHTHELSGLEVTGLAADPHGTSLAVCDRVTTSVHVLPWPLPGMLQ